MSKIEWVPYVERAHAVHRGPHRFTKRILHWPYCAGCGLVALKNEATRQRMRQPCEWEAET